MGSISGNSTNPGGSLAPAEEEFCLRWNDFRDSIASSLLELRRDKELLDVSLLLSDSDTLVSAHRVVLSACSSFFRSLLLKKGLGPNPVIVLSDVSSEDLDSVLTFMYNGEVKVKQEDLNSFLGVAEKLRVRGLCQGDKRSSAPNKTNPRRRLSGTQGSSPAAPGTPNPPSKRLKVEVDEDDRSSNGGEDDLVIDDNEEDQRGEDDDEGGGGSGGGSDEQRVSGSPMAQNSSSPLPPQQQSSQPQQKSSSSNPNESKENIITKEEHSEQEQPQEEYSEYGYAPDEGYNDKTIPPPVVGMMLGDRMDSMNDLNNSIKSGPWNSPNNSSMLRLSSVDGLGGRRPRSVYSTQQLTQLEAYFKFNEYIDGYRKKQLSIITQIPEQQIKVWFQNRRQKKKRELEEMQQSGGSTSNFHSALMEANPNSC